MNEPDKPLDEFDYKQRLRNLREQLDFIVKMDRAVSREVDGVAPPRRPLVLDPNIRSESD